MKKQGSINYILSESEVLDIKFHLKEIGNYLRSTVKLDEYEDDTMYSLRKLEDIFEEIE